MLFPVVPYSSLSVCYIMLPETHSCLPEDAFLGSFSAGCALNLCRGQLPRQQVCHEVCHTLEIQAWLHAKGESGLDPEVVRIDFFN